MKKPTVNDRMNISYIDKNLHAKIKIWCINETKKRGNQVTLAMWAKEAMEALTK